MVIILQVTVTDVNDNKAQFSATSYHFSVNENLDEGVVVAQITASDLDYGINGKFIKILLMKLEIYFDVKNKTFEFKKEHNKTLTLCYIQLFIQSESLNLPPPLGLVQYLIVHSESGLPFNLDSYTGTLSLTKELDFETRTSYQFTVRAFNKVTPNFYQETPVRISVLDVNDNSPLFVQSHFHFNLLDSSLDNAAVGVAMATDADSGRNGDVYYTLQPTVNSHLFE